MKGFSPSVFNNAWIGRTDIAKGNETNPNTAAQPNDLMTGSCVIGDFDMLVLIKQQIKQHLEIQLNELKKMAKETTKVR